LLEGREALQLAGRRVPVEEEGLEDVVGRAHALREDDALAGAADVPAQRRDVVLRARAGADEAARRLRELAVTGLAGPDLAAIGELHVGDVRAARRLLEEEQLLGAGERRRRVVGVRPVLDGGEVGALRGRLGRRRRRLDLGGRAATGGERENED